jgi:hypothetical protein
MGRMPEQASVIFAVVRWTCRGKAYMLTVPTRSVVEAALANEAQSGVDGDFY